MNSERNRSFTFAATGADDPYELASVGSVFLLPLFLVFLGRSNG
jgi:hypothetical protein